MQEINTSDSYKFHLVIGNDTKEYWFHSASNNSVELFELENNEFTQQIIDGTNSQGSDALTQKENALQIIERLLKDGNKFMYSTTRIPPEYTGFSATDIKEMEQEPFISSTNSFSVTYRKNRRKLFYLNKEMDEEVTVNTESEFSNDKGTSMEQAIKLLTLILENGQSIIQGAEKLITDFQEYMDGHSEEENKTALSRILIAGSRNYTDYEDFLAMMDELVEHKCIPEEFEIVSGMAKGTDSLAVQLAKDTGFKLHEFYADWDNLDAVPCRVTHRNGKTYNSLAGMNRNKEMEAHSDILVAFWDGESRGTKNMIDLMENAGKQVFIVSI